MAGTPPHRLFNLCTHVTTTRRFLEASAPPRMSHIKRSEIPRFNAEAEQSICN
jgi:hypothetical protein